MKGATSLDVLTDVWSEAAPYLFLMVFLWLYNRVYEHVSNRIEFEREVRRRMERNPFNQAR